MKTQIDKLTMKLGLWLIGERETPKEKQLRVSDAFHADRMLKMADLAGSIAGERDEAINYAKDSCHELECEIESLKMERDAAIKKHNSLKKRYDKLRATK